MRIFVEIEPETTYIGRVEDEVKTVEARMWFETDEDVEVLSLADYTKQVRKEVLKEIDYGAIRKMAERPDDLCYKDALCEYFLYQIQGEEYDK